MTDKQFKHKAENLKRLGMTEQDIDAEIAASKQHIKANIEQIQDAFVELGYVDAANKDKVKLTIGPELEFTLVAGVESYLKRGDQIKEEVLAAKDKGEHPSYHINDKAATYMPETANVKTLDKMISDPISQLVKNHGEKASTVMRTSVDAEPSVKPNMFHEDLAFKKGGMTVDTQVDLLASSQLEFSFPPYSAIGAAEALNIMMNKTIHAADKIGVKRADFTAIPNAETAVNSIHLNSVITVNGKNAFSKKEWEGGKAGTPSDLLLCIGKEHIQYLKHSLFMFARAESDYERYKKEEVSGPTYYGVNKNKQHGQRASAMFRGEGKLTERVNSAYPDKPDQGPMRFELRVPSPGAAGHPNKDAYPEQRIMPYQMIEAYTDMLAKGVVRWKQRELDRKQNKHVDPLHEEDFFPDTLYLEDPSETYLPHSQEIALSNFRNSPEAKEYWGDRMKNLEVLSDRLNQINQEDRSPDTTVRGPHVERLLTTAPQPHARGNTSRE